MKYSPTDSYSSTTSFATSTTSNDHDDIDPEKNEWDYVYVLIVVLVVILVACVIGYAYKRKHDVNCINAQQGRTSQDEHGLASVVRNVSQHEEMHPQIEGGGEIVYVIHPSSEGNNDGCINNGRRMDKTTVGITTIPNRSSRCCGTKYTATRKVSRGSDSQLKTIDTANTSY